MSIGQRPFTRPSGGDSTPTSTCPAGGSSSSPPRHSECSIAFGDSTTSAEPGSVKRLETVVSNIEAARKFLTSRGVEVSDYFHRGESGMEPGLDPDRASYNSYATFSDPDGNEFLLQEVTERLPGRLWED